MTERMREYLISHGWTLASHPTGQWVDPLAGASYLPENAYSIQRWRSLHRIRSMAEYWRWCMRQRATA
jgi:hypothetical protein